MEQMDREMDGWVEMTCNPTHSLTHSLTLMTMNRWS